MATTLAQLRTLAQQRADMVNSGFVATAEWNQYLNDGLAELYGLVAQSFGDDYLTSTTPYSFTTDGVNNLFALPSGFGWLAMDPEVQLLGAAGQNLWFSIPQFMPSERNSNVPYAVPLFTGYALRYRLVGGSLMLITPVGQTPPMAGYTIRLWYVPQCPLLVADGDSVPAAIDGFGWVTGYVTADAAMKALQKEESDITPLLMEKRGLVERIQNEAANRNRGSPQRVPADFTWWGD